VPVDGGVADNSEQPDIEPTLDEPGNIILGARNVEPVVYIDEGHLDMVLQPFIGTRSHHRRGDKGNFHALSTQRCFHKVHIERERNCKSLLAYKVGVGPKIQIDMVRYLIVI
jgi:hypothetical protein